MLDSGSINYALKKDNPANYPEIRQIKDFWVYFKGLVYGGKWEVKNVLKLFVRIKYCFKKVTPEVLWQFASLTKRGLNAVPLTGLLEKN